MKFRPNFVAVNDSIRDSRMIFNDIMKPMIYKKITDLEYEVFSSKEPVDFSRLKTKKFKKINHNKSWGKEVFDCAWFHVYKDLNNINIDKTINIEFDINGEALLVDERGEPEKGFTNGSSVFDRELSEPGKIYYPIYHRIKNNKLDLYFDAAYNDLFGNIQDNGKVKSIALVTKDEEMYQICQDFDVLLTLLENITYNNKYFNILLEGIVKVRDLFWFKDENAKKKAKDILNNLLSIKGNNSNLTSVCAVGHAHLDLAWLWPIRETKRKAVRTLTNVFYLLEKYPEFTFVISQPQQLIWIKEHSNEMFERIKEYEKQGRIEIVGGAFVEFDTNVSGEEQLARQMLYGQKYYLENFGHYVNNLWLPDTFGYNGNLPQIIKHGGMNHFMTIKISWNRFNAFPYHNFIWEGIDGTRILSHLPPEGTYNSGASPKSLKSLNDNIEKNETIYNSLMIYGIGDGGGGPNEEHIERVRRINDLMCLNKVECGNVEKFFNGLEKKKNEMPIYKGELYLENHNGTYTSQSFNKQYNRKMEEKIKRLEMFLALNNIKKYNQKTDELYKRTLLLEFHDILPGSSIKRVYDESKKEYLNIDLEIDKILSKELRGYTQTYDENVFLFNHLNYPASKLVKFKDNYYCYDIKPFENSKYTKKYSYENSLSTNVIDSNKFSVKFNELGYIDSIIYKNINKEIVLNGANKLEVYQDHGDAWNIRENYRNQKPVLMKLENRIISKYEEIYEIKSLYSFLDSTVEEIVIIDNSNLITFKHKVNWKNTNYMLRSNFNLDINTDKAISDIQFGKIKRTRKNNTLKEIAQYEICAQQYVDISDDEIGCALINKTKCGYYIKDNDLELNLLRSTNYPCVNGDIGETSYEYALYVHEGDDVKSNVDEIAYIFNSDFLMSKEQIIIKNPFIMKNKNLQYSCIKNKYNGEGIIIRIYEKNGVKTKLNLAKTSLKEKNITLVNFIEEEINEEIIDNTLLFKPFEVKTLWVRKDSKN